MENEIIILCNSPECLNEVSGGNWPNLHTKNIFTCNFAYTHFRTIGRHLNIFSDHQPINAFLSHEDRDNVFTTMPYKNVQFVLNTWDLETKKIDIKINQNSKVDFKKSPVIVPASSGIGALFYLAAVENFDKIHLVGYTINEWEGIEPVKELKSKVDAFNDLYKKYEVTKPREFVYTYTKKILKKCYCQDDRLSILKQGICIECGGYLW